MIPQLVRLYHTLAPLRAEQWFFRVWHPLKRFFWRESSSVPEAALNHAGSVRFAPVLREPAGGTFRPEDNSFRFQNRTHSFGPEIDWDFDGHGLLWTYSLNYFSWLEDDAIPVEERLRTMRDFAAGYPKLHTGKASYPTSRRIIYWIRFLAGTAYDPHLARIVYLDAVRLRQFPERHLLGNHLWENACALTAAGHYFGDPSLTSGGGKLLEQVLHRQLLPDGMHCELSPSYHVLLLTRLVHLRQIAESANGQPDLIAMVTQGINRMTALLSFPLFRTGSLPRLNDIAPEPLVDPRVFLDEEPWEMEWRDACTSFLILRNARMELVADRDIPGCAEQPGHRHANGNTFILYIDGREVITDVGTSTYERGPRRDFERSSVAHNTVTRNDRNRADVWASFRMGRRETETGWRRDFDMQGDMLVIRDHCTRKHPSDRLTLRLHLPPGESATILDSHTVQTSTSYIRLDGVGEITLHFYDWAKSFHNLLPAVCITASLSGHSAVTTIACHTPDSVHAD